MKFVVYYRLSTRQQQASGLGLEAQKAAAESFLQQNKADKSSASYYENENGTKNDRCGLFTYDFKISNYTITQLT